MCACVAAVYNFVVWDHENGENVVAPRKATLEAIARVKGAADLSTETLVDESDSSVPHRTGSVDERTIFQRCDIGVDALRALTPHGQRLLGPGSTHHHR
jgi:hypothetical protein